MIRLVLVLAGAATLAAGGLVERHSKAAGFAIELPASWSYRNATYPSDHSTEFWRDPANANRFLEAEVSACVGCVEPTKCVVTGKGPCGPRPENLLPRGATWQRKLDKWSLRFRSSTSGKAYPDEGLVVVLHRGADIQGFALLDLYLPAAARQLAGTILGSFKPPR